MSGGEIWSGAVENLFDAALLPATVMVGISAGLANGRAARFRAVADDAQAASSIHSAASTAWCDVAAERRRQLTDAVLESDDLREQIDDLETHISKIERERNVLQREKLELATTCHSLLDEIETLRRRLQLRVA